MKTLLLSIIMAATAAFTQAQTHTADEQAVNKQIEKFTASWNNHDFSDFKNYTTEDCDWVNVVGMWWKGRKQVEFAHSAFHQGMFKNTPLTTLSTEIRFVTKDVAIAHVVTKIGAYYPPDGVNHGGNKAGDENNMGTIVLVKKENVWLITSCENVPIKPMAGRSNPVLKMQN